MPGVRPTILVVEDDPCVRELVATILSDEGYRVLEAQDGLDAIRIVDGDLRTSREPCIVLLDVRLPTVDGVGVLHHVAAHGDDIAVVAMSGSGEHLASALQAGASAT